MVGQPSLLLWTIATQKKKSVYKVTTPPSLILTKHTTVLLAIYQTDQKGWKELKQQFSPPDFLFRRFERCLAEMSHLVLEWATLN